MREDHYDLVGKENMTKPNLAQSIVWTNGKWSTQELNVRFEIGGQTIPPLIAYAFEEDKVLEEIKKYIDNTYNAHYSHGKYQATETITDAGHGIGFCLGSILKYWKRYGKKGDKADARNDLLKIIHYAIIAIKIHDDENNS